MHKMSTNTKQCGVLPMQEKLYFQKIKQFSTQNRVIKGTLILTTAGFATRIIGFYNRIFLSRLIGAKELGIY